MSSKFVSQLSPKGIKPFPANRKCTIRYRRAFVKGLGNYVYHYPGFTRFLINDLPDDLLPRAGRSFRGRRMKVDYSMSPAHFRADNKHVSGQHDEIVLELADPLHNRPVVKGTPSF